MPYFGGGSGGGGSDGGDGQNLADVVKGPWSPLSDYKRGDLVTVPSGSGTAQWLAKADAPAGFMMKEDFSGPDSDGVPTGWTQPGLSRYGVRSQRLTRISGTDSAPTLFPAALDYSVEFTTHIDAAAGSSDYVRFWVRASSLTANGPAHFMNFDKDLISSTTGHVAGSWTNTGSASNRAFNLVGTHRIRLDLSGSEIKVYVDGVLVWTTASSVATGKIAGFSLPGLATVSEVVLFNKSFEPDARWQPFGVVPT